MKSATRASLAAALLMVPMLSASVRAEDWTEPKDGLFTEKQLTNSIAAQKEMYQLLKAMGKAVEGGKTGLGAMAMVAGLDDKVNAIAAKHELKRPEYDWLAGQTFQLMGVAMIDSVFDQAKVEVAQQMTKNAADIELAKKKVADYEAATKANTRVLTPEQRESAISSAKGTRDGALEEVKQHADEAKTAADEATKAESDAKAADALANHPPADVEKDAREEYIAAKKAEAESFRATATEARTRETEARKAGAEAKARADAATTAMNHPEVPLTDEEKAQVKSDNESGLTAAKSDLETTVQAGDLLKESAGPLDKQKAETHKDIKEENLVLVKKHLKELKDALGIKDEKN